MSSYFSHLPNIYVGQEDANEVFSYQLVKNIFRRVILQEKLEKYTNSYESFYIPDGMRPEMVAYTFYKDAQLDWIILLANNIVDPYEDWPKDKPVLNQYVLEKYGSWDDIHHYETNEVKYNGSVFVKEGCEVNSDFRVVLPDGSILSEGESIYPVTNIEHETYLNEKKRLIGVPNSRYVDFFKEKFAGLVAYQKNVEVDKQGNKRTPISSASKFIDRASYRRNTSTTVAASGGDLSFNNGDTVTSTSTALSALQASASAGTSAVSVTTASSSSGGTGSSSSSSSSSNSGSSLGY